MTTVYEVNSERTWEYTLSPDQAVIAAYEQMVNRNFNTWTYREPSGYAGYTRTKLGHYCNGFWAKNS
jgi:hypothetical protein